MKQNESFAGITFVSPKRWGGVEMSVTVAEMMGNLRDPNPWDTLQEIIAEELQMKGYDGLVCDEECVCGVDDFMPCNYSWEAVSQCRCARMVDCKSCVSNDDDSCTKGLDYCMEEA